MHIKMASRLEPRYNVEDVHRFLFEVPGDGEVSDEENSSSDEGNVLVDQTETADHDPDYPEVVLPVASTSAPRGRGPGRGRGRGKGASRDRAPENVGFAQEGPVDEHVNKQYPVYHGNHGPTEFLPADSSVVDFFDMLFPPDAFDLLVDETNRYAQQKGGEWYHDTDLVEMRAFIGLLFFLGIHRLPEINNYFSSNWVFSVPAFARVFTRARFWQLWSNLHLADNNDATRPARNEPGYDKIWKLRPLFKKLVDSFQEKFYIGQNVSVDEMMVKGKGKNPLKQYLPLKPIKRGSKVWALGCSCCSYIYDMQVYCGKVDAGTVEHGLAFRVVTDLCEPHLAAGNNHVLYVDNFFTSIPLSRHLESVGIYCAGTFRSARKEYPQQLKDPALLRGIQQGEFHTATVGSHVLTVWKDTKVVSFISNVHSSHDDTSVRRKRKQDGEVFQRPCPPIVKDYNNNMGPVDGSDQMRQAYGIDRKSKRWWLRLFFFLLDVTMVNTYIIYSQWYSVMEPQLGNQVKLSHLLFRSYVIQGLVGNFTARRSLGPPPTPMPLSQKFVRRQGHESVHMVRLGLKSRGRCDLCSIGVHETVRCETVYGCAVCVKRLCRDTCHDRYHQQFFQ